MIKEEQIRADEREKCAQIAEFWDTGANPEWDNACHHIAGEIRKPGSKTTFNDDGSSGYIHGLNLEDLERNLRLK